MLSHLTLNDTSPAIGEPRLLINDPIPAETRSSSDQFHILAQAHWDLVNYVTRLENRIIALESRTWWSMLVSQVKSWFRST